MHSTVPNNGTGFRVVVNQNLFALPIVFLSATAATPLLALNPHTPETTGESSALGVRQHLLLEHFLI